MAGNSFFKAPVMMRLITFESAKLNLSPTPQRVYELHSCFRTHTWMNGEGQQLEGHPAVKWGNHNRPCKNMVMMKTTKNRSHLPLFLSFQMRPNV